MKTKIGISAGAFAALTFLLALYGGIFVTVVAAGYVFIAEKNEWLKTTVAKAVALSLAFSILSTLIWAIPNVISCLNEMIGIFSEESRIPTGKLSDIFSFLSTVLGILEKVFFLILALLAVKMKTIKIGIIDNFVAKHLLSEND